MTDFAANHASLSSQCRAYLDMGPPTEMRDYVPGSLTEIIIAHGAQARPLDPELSEIARLIVAEVGGFEDIENGEVRTYMLRGAELVRAVLEAQ